LIGLRDDSGKCKIGTLQTAYFVNQFTLDFTMTDSLDTVELVMALEEGALADLPQAEMATLKRISCAPRNFPWKAPDTRGAWPESVLVIGREGKKVLFHAGLPNAFGVGCVSAKEMIDNARVFPSLSRALFAFPAHHCEK
jgi:hypothetical protein